MAYFCRFWGAFRQNSQIYVCFQSCKTEAFSLKILPLTPSFVGSNPATPAKDTIYCIASIYGYNIWYFNFLFNLCQRGKRRKIGSFLEQKRGENGASENVVSGSPKGVRRR